MATRFKKKKVMLGKVRSDSIWRCGCGRQPTSVEGGQWKHDSVSWGKRASAMLGVKVPRKGMDSEWTREGMG